MTLLRGHFAMTLVAEISVSPQEIKRSLGSLVAEGLSVSVHPVGAEESFQAEGMRFLMSVHGADRPGIVSGATAVLARHGGNITDLSTRLAHGFYVLTAEVAFPAGVDVAAVSAELAATAELLGVTATLRPADEDTL